jgi:transcriptional regulator with XRE-family HTH domain/Tfp pilus assembly protein PilF
MTSRPPAAETTRARRALAISMGERLRQLRVSAGMTQSDLAGDRFSKEYVSQIERGKTRPTAETIEWLAARLGVDAGFLANGVSADARGRVETTLARAEALAEADQLDEAAELYVDIRTAVLATGLPELEARTLSGHGRVLLYQAKPREALDLLVRARELSEGAGFSDVERAEILFRTGVARYMLSSIATAIGLLSQALELAERSGMPCDQLRSQILHFRSRCYRRQRDFEAAREDVERALELAEGVSDRRTMGHLYFQASLLAEREGHWVLARNYAERAKAQYEEVSDRANVGRLLNNLGGLNFLLGKPEDAIRYLKDAFATALEVGSETDAAYAVSSLAQVHLRTGSAQLAEEQARHALELLAGRVDLLDEIGNAQLVLGRALLEQDRLDEAESQFTAAQTSFDQLSSASHRAAAWVAQGDLATRRGDDRGAARLYRMAAEALQDVRF